MNKLTTLKEALKGRDEELFHYQINIDNYERALKKLIPETSNPTQTRLSNELIKFRDQLIELLETSIIEKTKSQIIRDVIAEQIAELES